jgi:predicted HTH domain antitoxin
MTLTLPDQPGLPEAEVRLELACALYARGKIGKVAGAEIAGIDFFSFQQALAERKISTYSVELLKDDVKALHDLRS